MSKKMNAKEWAYLIVCILLTGCGITFLALSMFRDEPGTRYLSIALGCIAAANLINLIRIRMRKREKEKNEQP